MVAPDMTVSVLVSNITIFFAISDADSLLVNQTPALAMVVLQGACAYIKSV